MRAAPARHVLGSALLVFRACLICSRRMPWKWAFRRPGHNGDQAISGQNKQVAPSLRQGQGRMHCGDSVVQCPQESQRGTCLSYSAPSSDRPLQRIAGPTLHRCDGTKFAGRPGPKGRTWVSARVGRNARNTACLGLDVTCQRGLQAFVALPISLATITGWRDRGQGRKRLLCDIHELTRQTI
jgi:hypothetical protein